MRRDVIRHITELAIKFISTLLNPLKFLKQFEVETCETY
ncbi:hypothetical protein NARC_140055 [Candidatus Nitrosocosmicus arcticus]|uniref:Uncharacterized protein n=1 Tax=Candidatus Nitrosocosmicus arcticus TaxID=2035267 RepID=A0A557SSM8_9ARCH|nr:hypothetical protein NARC_140055 [Candidatus Nitrosocosmicus arcticus]